MAIRITTLGTIFLMVAIIPALAEDCSYLQSGLASVYSEKFNHRRTSSGDTLHMEEYTAAHKTLKPGTRVKVVDDKTQRSTYVTINDKGPKGKRRVIDLTRAPASDLGFQHGRQGLTGIRKVSLFVCN